MKTWGTVRRPVTSATPSATSAPSASVSSSTTVAGIVFFSNRAFTSEQYWMCEGRQRGGM